MRPAPAEVYGTALHCGVLYLRDEDGARRPLPLDRWLGPLRQVDAGVLTWAAGPVLDIGCGPGRHVLALARRGELALGVDISPAAARHARDRGAWVLLQSVFDPIPGAGHWRTALLLDGNIGIGGNPAALLLRLRALLADDGRVVCELDPPGSVTRSELMALENEAGVRSTWFAWARVSVDGVASLARRVGMRLEERWEDGGRWFAVLTVAHQMVSNSNSTASA